MWEKESAEKLIGGSWPRAWSIILRENHCRQEELRVIIESHMIG